MGLNQRLASKHPFPHLSHDVFSVIPPHQNHTAPSSAHPAHTAQPVDKIDARVWDVIQDDVSNHDRVDAARSQVRHHKDLYMLELSP